MSLFLKSSLVQIPTVSSRRMLINNESMNMLESGSTASMVKWNESLIMYLLVVNGSNSAVTVSFLGEWYKSNKKCDKLGIFFVLFSRIFKGPFKNNVTRGGEKDVLQISDTRMMLPHTKKKIS